MSPQPLNPIKSLHKQKMEITGQQRGQGTWLTIHQEEEINQPKKHLKDLVVFTKPPQRENPVSQLPYLYIGAVTRDLTVSQ